MEQMGETSEQVYMPAQANDDRCTYITPDTEVHFEVFVDEGLDEKIEEVTSPKFGEKKRVRKRAPALCTPYTVGEKPKHRKQKIDYDLSQPLDEARVRSLWSCINSIENPKKTRQ